MRIEHLFLYEYIPKGSNVIIYGLGDVGQSYIKQVKYLKWCNIVGISDQRKLDGMLSYPFYDINELSQISDYDYVVIAIEAFDIASQVYDSLYNLGINEEKILNLNMRKTTLKHHLCSYKDINLNNEPLRVALKLDGGLGDYIVHLSVFNKIVEIEPNIIIDIFCNEVFGRIIYRQKKNLRKIISEKIRIEKENYDIILNLRLCINVEKCNYQKLESINSNLSVIIRELESEYIYSENAISQDYRDSVLLKRASIMGYDRYSALGGGSLLGLHPEMSKIELFKGDKNEFIKLNLTSYITLNYGADTLNYTDKVQTKVWPLEYFEKFVELFKSNIKGYEIVQVGSSTAKKIKGVNRYFLGEDLEIVKYILKKSSIHLDCEGGLVHLATQLGTKCMVLFGPTPLEFYGYKKNINLTAGKCLNCMGITKDWFVTCYKKEDKPECMYGITPERVLDEMRMFLENNV